MHHPLPQATAMDISGLIAATARLNSLMAEETALLKSMRMKEIGKFQDEKARLGILLESYQQRMASDPKFLAAVDDETREELVVLTDALAFHTEENFRHISVARAVNQRVMQAIMDVVSDGQSPGVYGAHGQTIGRQGMTISMNLNQRA